MNILTLVCTLLITLTIMTYTYWEKYKNFSATVAEYESYMEAPEEELLSSRRRPATSKDNISLRQMSISTILRKKERTDAVKFDRQRKHLKELMTILYAHAFFYKELEQRRSNFLDQLISALIDGSSTMEDTAITRSEDLAKIPISDPELRKAFTLMLRGTVVKDKIKQESQPVTEVPDDKAEAEMEEGADEYATQEKEKPLDDDQYYSLIPFVNYDNGQLHVSLASEELLEVYFPKETARELFLESRALRAKFRGQGASTERKAADEAFKTKYMNLMKDRNEASDLNFTLFKPRESKPRANK